MQCKMSLNPIVLLRSIRPFRTEHFLLVSSIFMDLSKSIFPNATIGTYIFLATAVFMFFSSFIISFRKKLLIDRGRGIYLFFTLWTIILTIQVLFTGTQGQGTNFSTYFGSNSLMPYFIPLTVMCYGHSRHYDLRYLFNILWLFCIIYLIYMPFVLPKIISVGAVIQNYGLDGNGEFYRSMLGESTILVSFFPGFLCLFCRKYLNKTSTILFVIACLLQLFIVMYMARRGSILLMLLNFLCFWYIYNRSNFFIKIIKVLGIIIILYVVWSNYDGSMFSILLERQNVDSRGGLVDAFINDMTLSDWIFGRGLFGQYYDVEVVGGYRNGLEVGFLHLILKGGLLYLIPYVIILLISVYNGLFKSCNILCRAFGSIALVRAVSLISFGVPFFTIQEFIVWVGVFLCNSSIYRNMSDNEVYTIINS